MRARRTTAVVAKDTAIGSPEDLEKSYSRHALAGTSGGEAGTQGLLVRGLCVAVACVAVAGLAAGALLGRRVAALEGEVALLRACAAAVAASFDSKAAAAVCGLS